MSSMTFAWELGQNYGHLLGFLPVARTLEERGHDVQLLLRDLSRARRLVDNQATRLYQAPIWVPQLRGAPPPLNFAELLFSAGYLDPDGLRGLVEAWLNLFEAAGTDLLIADHAPTALLAARIDNRAAVTLGTGFTTPPAVAPLPPLCWWNKPDAAAGKRMQDSEKRALATINAVLDAFDTPPLAKLSDLFSVARQLLCTFPELDHYPNRADVAYLGPRFTLDDGIDPPWPEVEGPRVFAYLHPGNRQFEPLLQMLKAMSVAAVVHAPGLATERASAMSSANVHITPALIRMDRAGDECDVALCHGGMGTVSAMLVAGKPVLIAPTQLEQTITARNVEQAGLGLALREDHARYPPSQILDRLLNDQRYRERAGTFAALHGHDVQRDTVQIIADSCGTITRTPT